MKKIFSILIILCSSLNAQDTLFVDCNGTDASGVVNWVGDGWCDDGAYSWNGNDIYFNCEEFNYDDGDCPAPIDTVLGCMDMLALNYVPEANINDESCEYPVFGCIDSEAPNYNPWAEADDGSCVGVSCSDGEAKIILQLTLDQYPSETGWVVTDLLSGEAIDYVSAGGYSYSQANQTITYDVCIPSSGANITISDTYGDGLAGSLYGGVDGNVAVLGDIEPCGSLDTIWTLPQVNFGNASYSDDIWLEQCTDSVIEGCTNNAYIEFDLQADLDNGSCETLHTIDCTDSTMFNYNPEATLNYIIPTCDYTLTIEDDGGDGWGDSYIGIVQGDSILNTYTMEPGSYYKEFNITLQTNEAVKVYYFEIANPQTPQAEVAFQTMHNSFTLINSNGVTTLQGGVYPFAENGAGALKAFKPPLWNVYSAIPYCGDYCEPIVYGCIYPTNLANPDVVMFNYNPEANTYDPEVEPCIPVIEGCTDNSMYGYNSLANVDDGSCMPWFIGCMDSLAWNYNSLVNLNNSESCLYFGCMDSLADNYNPIANVELEGTCFTTVLGCTDETAFNYNPEANTEDFSCIQVIFGCMDSLAFNYDSLANTSNDNCIDIEHGCMDQTAENYNYLANTEDNSCLYDAGCVGGPGEPYWLNDTCYAWVIMIDPYCCNNNWDNKCQELYWNCSYGSELSVESISRNNILIYPNPTHDVINIITYTKMKLEVYDSSGKLVILVRPQYLSQGENQLDVSQLPAGIYSFNITYNNNTLSKKVIKR